MPAETRRSSWLDTARGRVPEGPPIWICGDCHMGNLGPVANIKGKVEIQIRDLDQAVIGNPSHDLVRVGFSLATSARGSDLPGVTTAQMLEQMIIGYADALKYPQEGEHPSAKSDKPIQFVIKQALNRKWRQLATERIENTHPSIPLRRNFLALSLDESKEIAELFQHKETKELVTCLHDRSKHDKVEVLDAAYWVKGCSSLGHLRCAVLLGVGKSFCLIDLKEAVRPAAPGYKSSGIPRNHAEREVEAARQLSPFLGEPDARREV